MREMLETVISFFLHMDVFLASIMESYGNLVYIFLFIIIFIETGFVLTPFLPGDSLIFLAGTLAASGALNVYYLFILLSLAAILGDTVNYWVGHYFGQKVFQRFLKTEHLDKTKAFFHNHGKKTIVLARYIPIVRTFAPFVAGIGKMKYSTFLWYNIIGGLTWVALFVFSGYFFGNLTFVKENLTIIILLIIMTSFIPPLMEYFKKKKADRKTINP